MQLVISKFTATSAVGNGLAALQKAIAARRSGLVRNNLAGCDLNTWIGRVNGLEDIELPERLGHLHSRNNQLAWLGLQQDGFLQEVENLIARLGAQRVGVIMGTSTSSIGRTEEAYLQLDSSRLMSPEYRQAEIHNLHSPGIFVAKATGAKGPAFTLSTACSSSAKVFASADRWLRHGIVDAVLVGGIDTLCLSVLYGFNSLELISEDVCRPFDQRRNGINLGEAAGFAILTRSDVAQNAELTLLGYGESLDAHHMSHPHPEGKGAVLAIDHALRRSGLKPDDIDYVNLHGTASKPNDLVETLALGKRFTKTTLASSTKGWTGHTLGASGALEAVITLDAMSTGKVPGTLNCEQSDPELDFQVITDNVDKPLRLAMTNSFGFGGNNATLIFGHAHD
jgi:3-oxoacyl-[acyl-carrier-protein] synthase-1